MKQQDRQVIVELVPAKDAAERYERAFALILRPIFERKRKELAAQQKEV
jgi:hypothetical protein